MPPQRSKTGNDDANVVGLVAALVCVRRLKHSLRGIAPDAQRSGGRLRRPDGAEEPAGACGATVGNTVRCDHERFARAERKDGIAGVVGQRDAQHRAGGR
jgi:hypothetical protein